MKGSSRIPCKLYFYRIALITLSFFVTACGQQIKASTEEDYVKAVDPAYVREKVVGKRFNYESFYEDGSPNIGSTTFGLDGTWSQPSSGWGPSGGRYYFNQNKVCLLEQEELMGCYYLMVNTKNNATGLGYDDPRGGIIVLEPVGDQP